MAYAKINSVTNANMAKVNNAAKAALGKIGSIDAPATGSWASTTALSFDGTNDHVTTGTDGTVASKTYVWWMKATQTTDNHAIFSHDTDSGAVGGFFLNHFESYGLSREYLYYHGSLRRQWDDNAAQDDGNWHHWVLYLDTSDVRESKLYVDGSEVSIANTTGSTSGLPTSWDPLKIGFGNSNYAAFILSEFAIFNGNKISSIGTYYNSGTPWDMTGEDDLDLYYIFEEGSGTSVTDSSTNDNAGTLVNSPTWVTDAP
tara:strand:- start:421 stop:1194 length:774 start_codon:yes stop_codon:yes gene_type:complete